jgi:predicted anti-sigma-YlaC factor YlaD
MVCAFEISDHSLALPGTDSMFAAFLAILLARSRLELSMTRLLRLSGLLTLVVVAALSLSACSARGYLVRNIADELAGQGQAPEDDVQLAREASAFYLKLSESVLRQTPGHVELASSVAAGFTQYAYGFVAFEADRIESRDARAAQKLRERARRLYQRAHRHAMAALEARHPGFASALAQPDPTRWPTIEPAEVGLAYWAAASWGGYISLSKDHPDDVADLPLAIRLATQAWQTAPDHGDGALASLMGSFELARPGGSRPQAQVYFDRAITVGAGKSAGAYVAKAEGLALTSGDRAEFEALLRQALAAAAARPDLSNQVMRERAQWLLDSADDLF